MLRITKVDESPTLVTMKLEGKIASDWVSLLERECLGVLQEKRKVVLDLSDVRFVDEGGVEMLGRMTAEGIHVINCSAPINVDQKEKINERSNRGVLKGSNFVSFP